MKRKWLAVGIILLFVGVALAPSINTGVVTASQNNDLVEVTTQACGIKGYKDTTVKLTREQYQDLQEYIVEFRARLNQTTTREQAIPIFKEAVMELDKYGLLPKGMSVEQAQKLVTCAACNSYLQVMFRRILSSYQPLNTLISNSVCLIAGQTSLTCFRGSISNLLYEISWNIGHRNLSIIIFLLSMYLDVFRSINPFCLGNRVYLGYDNGEGNLFISYGWMATIGLLGIQKTQGDMIGSLPIKLYYYSFGPFPSWTFYPGVLGFFGIKLSIITSRYSFLNDCSYLGSALWVQIGSEPPE